MRNLYLVKSRGFRAYVIAEDTNSAWEKFKAWLCEKDYGYFAEREFDSVSIVARENSDPKTRDGCSYDDGRKDDKLFL